jgi:hypothetical protein
VADVLEELLVGEDVDSGFTIEEDRIGIDLGTWSSLSERKMDIVVVIVLVNLVNGGCL